MRIAYLCHRVPYPPDKGCRIRAFHELVHLGKQHDIHLLSLSDSDEDSGSAQALRQICSQVEFFRINRTSSRLRALLGLFGTKPLTLSYFHSPSLARRVAELASSSSYDVVFAYCSAMADFARQFDNVPRVVDIVDVDSDKWSQYARRHRFPQRSMYRIEAARLRAFEVSLFDDFERVIVATEAERRLISSFAPNTSATAIRNGIDLDYFQPQRLPKAEVPTLVFTGQMDYFPNVDGILRFAHTVFPRLRRRFPDLRVLVVGRSPTKEVLGLERIPGVSVTGAVDDVRPFLARAWVFVAPLRIARGIQNKVLEAMSMKLPVVVSQECMAGLADGGFRPGEHLETAATEELFERSVADLLKDPKRRERLGNSARRQLSKGYSWKTNMEELESTLVEVRSGHPKEAALARQRRGGHPAAANPEGDAQCVTR